MLELIERIRYKVACPVYRLSGALDSLSSYISHGRRDQRTTWDKLKHVDDSALAAYLSGLWEQDAAAILFRLRDTQVAQVFAQWPAETVHRMVIVMLGDKGATAKRMARLGTMVEEDFLATAPERVYARDGADFLSQVFNKMKPAQRDPLMEAVAETNPEGADLIATMMFTFEDLCFVLPGGLPKIIAATDLRVLATALKGSSDTMKELFFRALGDEGAASMRQRMDELGPVRLRDVDTAQVAVITITKRLAAEDAIVIAMGDDEGNMLVY